MKRKICCFAGHSKLYDTDEIENRLLEEIEKLISENNVTEFWVGNYGAFDRISKDAVRKIKSKYPHIKLCLIIPYLTRRINEEKEKFYCDYDEILMAEIPDYTPKKFYISKCNQYMVNMSEYVICYVKYSFGGAARTMEYAKTKKHITIINLAL